MYYALEFHSPTSLRTYKLLHEALGASSQSTIAELTKVAHVIIDNRSDVASLTEDNRGRLERRLMYKIYREYGNFEGAAVRLFDSLWTEAPPVIDVTK